MTAKLKTCSNGHQFYKSSDCPVCPTCEELKKPSSGMLSLIAAPARRALQSQGITTLEELSTFSEKEIASLHGMGPSAMTKLKTALMEQGLHFNK